MMLCDSTTIHGEDVHVLCDIGVNTYDTRSICWQVEYPLINYFNANYRVLYCTKFLIQIITLAYFDSDLGIDYVQQSSNIISKQGLYDFPTTHGIDALQMIYIYNSLYVCDIVPVLNIYIYSVYIYTHTH